jgi:hypothetical protein
MTEKMKRIAWLGSVVMAVLMLQSCIKTRFYPSDFYEKTADHRIIAILPFEMVMTGRQPKKLTVEQTERIEEVESLAFQNSLLHRLFGESTHYRRPLRIDIQSVTTTNRILDEHGISIRESWYIDPQEAARLLNVDAVIKTRVIKRRYMSDLASFGIELGSALLDILSDSSLWIFFPNRTNDIKAECYLYNGRDGAVLWGIDVVESVNWSIPANEMIDRINDFFVRKFPYR